MGEEREREGERWERRGVQIEGRDNNDMRNKQAPTMCQYPTTNIPPHIKLTDDLNRQCDQDSDPRDHI